MAGDGDGENNGNGGNTSENSTSANSKAGRPTGTQTVTAHTRKRARTATNLSLQATKPKRGAGRGGVEVSVGDIDIGDVKQQHTYYNNNVVNLHRDFQLTSHMMGAQGVLLTVKEHSGKSDEITMSLVNSVGNSDEDGAKNLLVKALLAVQGAGNASDGGGGGGSSGSEGGGGGSVYGSNKCRKTNSDFLFSAVGTQAPSPGVAVV